MKTSDICPHCSASLIGALIPEGKRHYYGQATHYRREIAIEVLEAYDGALFYRCPDCHRAFHRWPRGHPLEGKAEAFMSGDPASPDGIPPYEINRFEEAVRRVECCECESMPCEHVAEYNKARAELCEIMKKSHAGDVIYRSVP